MNKKMIIGLIALMSISLVGIIAVQVFWIKNAVKEREKQFAYNVNSALNKVSEKTDRYEVLGHVIEIIEHTENKNLNREEKQRRSNNINQSKSKKAFVSSQKPKNEIKFSDTLHLNNLKPDRSQIYKRKYVFSSDSPSLSVSFNTGQLHKAFIDPSVRKVSDFITIIKKDDTSKIIFLNIAGDNSFNYKMNINADRIKLRSKLNLTKLKKLNKKLDSISVLFTKKTFRENFNNFIFKLDSADIKLFDDTLLFKNLGFKEKEFFTDLKNNYFTSEYPSGIMPKDSFFVIKPINNLHTPQIINTDKSEHTKNVITVSIKNEIDKKKRYEYKRNEIKDITKKLVEEMEKKNNIPIEQRIDTTKISSLLASELENKGINSDFTWTILKNNKPNQKYKVQLFPHDIIPETNYLSVSFPNEENHIYESMTLMLAGSGIFTLFIILTFGITMHIILRQKKISEIKSDFINNMTHEFKTPIATISLATDSINNPKIIDNKERVKQFTNIIKEENARMNKQVETILQIAAFDKKEFIFSSKQVDIHKLINFAVKEMSLQVMQKGGKISFLPKAENTIISADPTHYKNMIRNLLDNANKYTKNKPDIIVETQNIKNEVSVSIEDNGIGMSRETRKNIFEKFYRKTTGNIHNVKGFGLGLSYVKTIADACKGRVEVKSELGKGSKFTLFFPVTKIG